MDNDLDIYLSQIDLNKESSDNSEQEYSPQKETRQNIASPSSSYLTIEETESNIGLFYHKIIEKYHDIKEFNSISALEEEIKCLDYIIKGEKSKKSDTTYLESKREACINQIHITNDSLQKGKTGSYYKIIEICLGIQEKNVLKATEETKSYNKELIIARIQKRIRLMKAELEHGSTLTRTMTTESDYEQSTVRTQNSHRSNKTLSYNEVLSIAQEYSAAQKYLKEHELQNFNEANERVSHLVKILVAMKTGKTVNENEVYPRITPEIITGISEEKRKNAYNVIIINLKQNNKNNIKDKEILVLEKLAENIWTPVPKIVIEKIGQNKCVRVIKIYPPFVYKTQTPIINTQLTYKSTSHKELTVLRSPLTTRETDNRVIKNSVLSCLKTEVSQPESEKPKIIFRKS